MIPTVSRVDDGWLVTLGGEPYLHAVDGGTGPCWNIREAGDEGADRLHVCDLDDLISALTALRDSDAHKQNVERWTSI